MSESQLVRTIRAHIAAGDRAAEKSEQHYIAAGLHLKELKETHSGTWAEWEDLLKTKIGIGKSRASELMQIADGRKTVEQVRERAAEGMRQIRAKASPSRDGANAGKHEGVPTVEAADESYQETLYDRACLFLESMTDETRQRFFAHLSERFLIAFAVSRPAT